MAGAMDVNARLTADTASFDSKMEKSAGVATATGRAVERAAERARAAWAKELLAQERAAEAQSLVARRKELAALQSDILARSLSQEALATERVTVAAGHGVTQVQAASAAVRSFEGNPGIRAVERFITTIPGAGAALQSIFPIIGAVAFGAVVVKMGEEFYALQQKGKHATDELSRAFGELNGKIETGNDELALQNARLEDEIGKLSKHPTNGLQTALAEARVEADKLQDSLAGDLKALDALLKEHEVGHFEGLISGVGATTGATQEIGGLARTVERAGQEEKKAYAEAMKSAGTDQGAREAATKAHYERMDKIAGDAATKMRNRANDIATQQKAAQRAADEANGSGKLFGKVAPVDLSPEQAAFEDAATTFERIGDRSALTATNVADQKAKAVLESQKTLGEAEKKAAELRFKSMEAYVAEWKTLAPVTGKAIYDYWEVQRASFAAGSQQYNSIVEKQAALAEEGARKTRETIAKLLAEEKHTGEERAALSERNPMTAWNRDNARTQADRYDASNEQNAQTARNAARLAELQIQEASGRTMTTVAAATALATVHTREYGAELFRLEQRLEALRTNPALTGSPDEQQRQMAEMEKRIADVKAGRQVQIQQDQYNIQPPNTSLLVGATSALEEFMRSTTDAGRTLDSVFTSALSSTNAGILRELTERHTHGEHVFGNVGAGIFKQVADAGLNNAEGTVLKALGLGGNKKPTGTASDPLHVVMAGMGATSGVTSALSKLNLGDAGLPGGKGGDGGGWMNTLGGIAMDAIPFFADGVSNFGGGMAFVGEQGPELVHLPRGASVTPNNRLGDMMGGGGGDMHFHVDARGSNDPAQTEAAVNRALYRGAPSIMAATMHRQMEQQKRLPSSMRR